MAEKLVTLEIVQEAMARLSAAGKRISARGIREEIGGFGSMTTILAMMKQAQTQSDQPGEQPQEGRVQQYARAISQAAEISLQRLLSDNAERESLIAEDMQAIEAEAAERAAEIERLHGEIERLRTERDEIAGKNEQLNADLVACRGEVTALHERAREAELAAAKAGAEAAGAYSLERAVVDLTAKIEATRERTVFEIEAANATAMGRIEVAAEIIADIVGKALRAAPEA